VTTRRTRSLARHHSNERAQGSRARNDPRKNQQTGDRQAGTDRQADIQTDSCGPRPPRSASLTRSPNELLPPVSPVRDIATSPAPVEQHPSVPSDWRRRLDRAVHATFVPRVSLGPGGAEKFRLIDIERPRGAPPTRSPGATITHRWRRGAE